MELLFVLAHWHSLAKLRMHNDLTLDVLDAVTISLGEKLREFNNTTCSAFITQELDREFNARVRRQAKDAAKKKSSTAHQVRRTDSVNGEADNQQRISIVAIEPEDAGGLRASTRRLKHFS